MKILSLKMIVFSLFFFAYSCDIPTHGACDLVDKIGVCYEYWKNEFTEKDCKQLNGKFRWQGCLKSQITHVCDAKERGGDLQARMYLYENFQVQNFSLFTKEVFLKSNSCLKYEE